MPNRINSNNWKLRNQDKQRKHRRTSSVENTTSPKIYSPIPKLLFEPAIEERSSYLNDPKQVKAIYHYLQIVADKNYSDKDQVAASEHLAEHYFKCPTFSKSWKINQASIIRELNNTGTEIIDRTKACLFEAVEVMEGGQTKKEAVKAVRNKLNILMLDDLLGEGWRKRTHRARMLGLGFSQVQDDLPIEFLAQESGWNADLITTGIRGKTSTKRIVKSAQLSRLESDIYSKQIIDKTNLSEFQRNVIEAMKRGMRATEFANLFNTSPERVRKEHQRARDKIKKTLEILNRDK